MKNFEDYKNDPKWDDIDERVDRCFKALIITALVLFIASLFIPQRCRAQVVCDTIPINYRTVVDIIKKTNKSNKPVYYAVYNYEGVEDITTVSKSVVDYIEICNECKLEPKLALRVKNGEVVSVIRQKVKNVRYKVQKR